MNTSLPAAFAASACAFLLALALPVFPAGATTVIPPDFSSLVKKADVVFTGEVTQVRSEWTEARGSRRIQSHTTFRIIRALKGDPANPYVLTMDGGTVGPDTYEVIGAPQFKVGDKALLFVEGNGKQAVPIVGVMFGHFEIVPDPQSDGHLLVKYNGRTLKGIDEIDAASEKGAVTQTDPSFQSVTADRDAAAEAEKRPPMKCADFENMIAREVAKPSR